MSNESPSERLQRHITDNTLVRNEWGDGYERACLLAAIAPECATQKTAAACPASLLAPWFAYMVPSMDDRGTEAAWPAMVQRFQLLTQKLEVSPLTPEAWERARLRSLHASVIDARSHVAAEHVEVLAAVDGVLQWLDAGAPEEDRESVRAAARAAARAARAAWAAAARAAWAAWAAVARAARAAEAAAEAAEAAAEAEAEAAAEAAWDRLTDATLSAVEAELALVV